MHAQLLVAASLFNPSVQRACKQCRRICRRDLSSTQISSTIGCIYLPCTSPCIFYFPCTSPCIYLPGSSPSSVASSDRLPRSSLACALGRRRILRPASWSRWSPCEEHTWLLPSRAL